MTARLYDGFLLTERVIKYSFRVLLFVSVCKENMALYWTLVSRLRLQPLMAAKSTEYFFIVMRSDEFSINGDGKHQSFLRIPSRRC